MPIHIKSWFMLFKELGEFEKAKELFFKAIEIQNNYGDAFFNLAKLSSFDEKF